MALRWAEEFDCLPYEYSVFQTQKYVIYRAWRLLNKKSISGNLKIFVDNQTLKSYSFTSPLVRQCKEELNRLRQLSGVTLLWIPANRGYFGNKKAETVIHLLSECLALTNRMYKYIGPYIIENLNEISKKKINDICKYLTATRWL